MKISSVFLAGTLAAMYLCVSTADAQDFAGTRTSDYFGVNGVFFNPAAIAGSPYRFDINLVSISPSVGNNKVAYRLKDLANTFDSDSIEDMVFGRNSGPANGMINADIHGPSFLFNTSAKTAFALTSRVRYMSNVTNLDGKLFKKLSDEFDNNADLPYTISSSRNMRVNMNAWSEFGVSMAHVVMSRNGHLLKAGATLKYLVGMAGRYIDINRLNGTLNTSPEDRNGQKVYLQNASGQISLGSGGIDLSDIQADQLLKANGSGIGADVGFVYEYRPHLASYDSITFRQSIVSPYKIRVSVSLLDLGGLSYHTREQSGIYDLNITGNEKLDIGELGNLSLDEYKSFFDRNPQYFTPAKGNATPAYKMTLPTSLLAAIDYRLLKGIYLNLEGRIALVGANTEPSNSYYYSSVRFTPRVEGRHFGIYLPVNYNRLTRLNAGFALRSGFLFFGSGSILTAVLDKSKQADFYLGIHISSLRRKNK
ncbi:MAG TPA: DUF5723 family protein [Chitinophagaceae bacterium]|nr:DUF5723 family protein [Chitinophagaceae bacterium]